MHEAIYLHAHNVWLVQTKASIKLPINLTLAGYLLFTVLGDRECQVALGTKAPYIVSV